MIYCKLTYKRQCTYKHNDNHIGRFEWLLSKKLNKSLNQLIINIMLKNCILVENMTLNRLYDQMFFSKMIKRTLKNISEQNHY